MPYIFCHFRRAMALLLVFGALISLVGCADAPSARELSVGLCSELSIDAVPYVKSAAEGEDGYMRPGLFEELYGDAVDYASDWAVLLLSSLFAVGECALLVCYDEYDASRAVITLERRLELLREVSAAADLDFPEGAFVRRYGSVAVLCALEDARAADRYFRRAL